MQTIFNGSDKLKQKALEQIKWLWVQYDRTNDVIKQVKIMDKINEQSEVYYDC